MMISAALLVFSIAQPTADFTVDHAEAYEYACPEPRRTEAAAQLEALKKADQADRQGGMIDPSVAKRDVQRRREVAAIFAEGCMVTAADHYNGAQVFQHGQVPAHFYQVYLWASRAAALGDERGRVLTPKAIDRYFLYGGYKQLFGSNASSQAVRGPDGEPTGEFGPFCLDPVAEGVTDEVRKAAGAPPLEERIAWLRGLNAPGDTEAVFCSDKELEEPPKGLFPGIW